MDETMHRVASATSHVADGTCIRTAKIEHSDDIKPGSASWAWSRADGTPVETEPWSCVPGTPPISHLEVTVPDDALDSSKLPLGVAALLEFQARADEYFREYEKALRLALGPGESDGAANEPTVTRLHYEIRPNGRQVQIDDRGWALKKNGQRDPATHVADRSSALLVAVMGELLMVYGPAVSGKTGRLVEHAARRYQDDRFASTLVLVPTARHGDQFRRRLVARCGVALDLDVSTLAQYARLHTAGRMLSRDVAADLLRRVSLERIASGGAGRFEPIAEKPGLDALIAEAVTELVAADVEPADFAAAAVGAGSADLVALADIYSAYRRALAERGWRDPAEAPSVAAEAIESGPAPPGLVLVDSFEFLNPREQSLVAALADRTRVLVAIDRDASERARWTASRLEALAGAAGWTATGAEARGDALQRRVERQLGAALAQHA